MLPLPDLNLLTYINGIELLPDPLSLPIWLQPRCHHHPVRLRSLRWDYVEGCKAEYLLLLAASFDIQLLIELRASEYTVSEVLSLSSVQQY